MSSLRLLFVFLLGAISLVQAHIVITYPGWRGDNLATNGTFNVDDYKDNLFPYGMQWMYPCGGLRISENRTYWPTTGGAVAFQPGWFQGHKSALLYVNLGIGSVPANYSLPMQKMFQITGPQNDAYPYSNLCLPQVPLPANLTVKEGDNATIQVVENAQHGASLYSCVDITFTNNMSLVERVTEDNCKNSSEIQFGVIYSSADSTGAAPALRIPHFSSILSTTVITAGLWLLL